MNVPADTHRDAAALIARRLGLHVPPSRSEDLDRSLLAGCRTGSRDAVEGYLTWLSALPDEHPEWRRLARGLTVGETYFFRDPASFAALEDEILPGLVAARRAQGVPRLRLWSAGCATGEEAYSLAIAVDRVLPDRAAWHVTLLATDINAEALAVAERGQYREWSFRATPAAVRDRYFRRRDGTTFELTRRIRAMVTFAPLNLATDAPSALTNTGAMDVVLCRNVLMYFTPEVRRAAAERLARALAPGGWLAVSPTEASADLFRSLRHVGFPGATFFRRCDAPTAPSGGDRGPASGTTAPPPAASAFPESDLATVSLPGARAEAPPPPPEPDAGEPAVDLARARTLADQGELADARHHLERLLRRSPLDPDAHLLLAAVCQEQGEIDAALAALRRVLYLAPDSALAYFLLGTLQIRGGDRARGRRAMETAAALLGRLGADAIVPGSGGVTTARVLANIRLCLELHA